MKKIITLTLALVCAYFNDTKAQNAAVDDSLFSKTVLLKHIETLSSDAFEGRRTGTKSAEKTQNYIIHQFDSLNVLSLFGKHYKQSFTFIEKGKTYHGINILGQIKGTKFAEKYIVLSAHYDHEGIKNGQIFNGADDNASGLCALFSFAEYFKNHPPKHSIILAAFDGEELGLQGSEFFINNPIIPLKNIAANLNMDMISRSDANELFVVGTQFDSRLKDRVLSTETPQHIKLVIGHDGTNWEEEEEDWTDASDHSSFHKKGIPFLYFGVEDHKDYHEPTDDYENIHLKFYIHAVETIISVFENIDGSTF